MLTACSAGRRQIAKRRRCLGVIQGFLRYGSLGYIGDLGRLRPSSPTVDNHEKKVLPFCTPKSGFTEMLVSHIGEFRNE